MSSTNSTVNQSQYRRRGHCGPMGRRGNWVGANIAAMVLGFVFFWPLGLVILFWIASGNHVKDLPSAIREQWSKLSGSWNGHRFGGAQGSDNVVFNDYQQTQYDRINEIKEEIKERARRFSEFRADAKRRADEAEFEKFMADAPVRQS